MNSETAPAYSQRIFAFIDILGFSGLVEESVNDPSRILRIYKLLERTKSMATLPVGHKFQHLDVDLARFITHTFSDTITMSCPFDSFDYFNAVVGWIEGFQYLMLTEEAICARGAIVYGNILDTEAKSMVFGPAMVAAYGLERRIAKWPRVVVDSSAIERLDTDQKKRAFKEYLRKGAGGIVYLDYLRDLFALTCFDRGKRLRTPSDPIALLNVHKFAIEAAVRHIRKKNEPSAQVDRETSQVLVKYARLAEYHNSVVDRLCRVVGGLQKNRDLIRKIEAETMALTQIILASDWERLQSFRLRFTPENPKYTEIRPILGIVIDQIVSLRKDAIEAIGNNPVNLLEFLCREAPRHLQQLSLELRGTRVDLDNTAQVTINN